MKKDKHAPDKDLKDTTTSLATLGKVMASKERHGIEDDVLLVILAPPLQQSMPYSI